MSFWDLSTGDQVKADTEYEAPSGGEPIPDDTDVMAYPDEVKWSDKDGAEYISIRWRVAKPEAYKNRVIFQKAWVLGNNPQQKDPDKRKKQGDNAKRMLAAIDANAGGELLTISGKPSDEQLQSALMNKFMVLKVKVWEMEGSQGDKMSGNWVAAVSPKTKGVSEADEPAPKAEAGGGASSLDSDEIPF